MPVCSIGDPAFDADHDALGLRKIDLGEVWTQMTGLPFIYAAWTGRAGAVDASVVQALQQAQAEGVAAREAIAAEYGAGDAARAARAAAYLRDNVRYGLGADGSGGTADVPRLRCRDGAGAPRRRAWSSSEHESMRSWQR